MIKPEFTATSPLLPDDLSEADWIAIGQKFARGHDAFWWHLGDWWCHGNIEFVDETKVDVIGDAVLAGGRWVKYIRIASGDRLWASASLKCRNFLPKVVQHRVRRRVTIVRAPMHFAAGDYVNVGKLLIVDRGLARPILRVGHRPHR